MSHPISTHRTTLPTIARYLLAGLFALSPLLSAPVAQAAPLTPPNTPTITEPSHDGQIVNAADVHMETSPFSDPDPGDTHECSDWEVWQTTPPEMAWYTHCITGVEKVHTHLGDGVFVNSHAGRTELFADTDYLLRARHKDNHDEWSHWAIRYFTTGSASAVFPLELDDVADTPTPSWTDDSGQAIILPAGPNPAFLYLESAAADLLLAITGNDGLSNLLTNPAALASHVAVRVHLSAGGSGGEMLLPESQLDFTDHGGQSHTVYVPALHLPANQEACFWVSTGGSTYTCDLAQTEPDFSELARGAAVPWLVAQPGYKVEIVATGFQLPVNIAFVPNPGPNPDDPFYYVTELYGTIKVVTRDGTVSDYATNLLNFEPTGNFPGSGEQGVAGLVVEPATGDVFASMLYSSNPADEDAPHYPRVDRFHSLDGGHTASTQTTILDMVGETQGQSHQVSNLTIGPDGKLYVHMGDGFDDSTALNPNSFRGKILRLNLDGTAPPDNPFYSGQGGARDYIYAYGFRNPFGGVWRDSDQFQYEVENGPTVDRLAKVVAGTGYGWAGSDEDMYINALYNWTPAHAPVNAAFIQSSAFGGSGFPADKLDHLFVTESGPTWATGAQELGKRVVEFSLDDSGNVVTGPTTLVEYNGSGKATASALAAGPDGLYFSDLYKDVNYQTPIDVGANILRIKFVGTADFTADVFGGRPPLTVHFTDQSTVVAPTAWSWDFGDGTTSSEQNPVHTYTTEGTYSVRLTVTGANGIAIAQKDSYIFVGTTGGLLGQYFNDLDLTDLAVTRTDPTVDFDWGEGSPDPAIGPDTFSVRWTGQVKPLYSERYTFFTNTDDGVRLWVDDRLIIDEWIDQPVQEWSGSISLLAGQSYNIKMEYYDNGSVAVAELRWQSAHQPKEIIPAGQLSPYPATITQRTALLNGANEVPPVTTTARGRALFRDDTGPSLAYILQMTNISSATDAVIQCAPAGSNGPVGVTLFRNRSISGTRTLLGSITAPDSGNACGWASLDDLRAAMDRGNAYVNIYTVAHPDGEIRGQIRRRAEGSQE